jgi:D-lyxose ketol-isomerase
MEKDSGREQACARAAQMIAAAGFVLGSGELSGVETADFGLGNPDVEGAQIFTLVQSPRVAAKLIVLFPGQTLPEHFHPAVGDDPGKGETIRVFRGGLSVCTPGADGLLHASIPPGKEQWYSCRRERFLAAGDQCFLPPGTKHWFQGGPEGAVAGSFSSVGYDERDRFSDPMVVRRPASK